MTKMAKPRIHGFGARVANARPAIATTEAPIIDARSPTLATSHPLGMSPTSWPTMIIAAMRPAIARDTPRSSATIGMMGMIAPSPIENKSVGTKAGSATDRKLKGAGVDIVTSLGVPDAGCRAQAPACDASGPPVHWFSP